MSRRRFLGAALGGGAGAALPALAGCGTTGGSVSQGTDHLGIWYWKGSLSEKLLATAERGVPGVPGLKVKGSPIAGEYKAKIRTSLAARAYVPDLAVANSDVSVFFPDEQEFLDLRELGADSVEDQYLDWKWKSGISPSGRMIGFPLDAGPTALYYRRDLFEKAGLPTEPDEVAEATSTWEKFLAAGRTLKAKAPGNPYLVSQISYVFRMVLYQSPKQFVDADNRFIGDQEHVKRAWDLAVETYRQGLSARLLDSTPDYNAAVSGGRVASLITAVWYMGGLKQTAPKTAGSWRLTSLPGGPTNYGGSYVTITRYCRDPEGAFAFLKWMLGPENQLKAYQEMALFPTTPAAYDKPAMREGDPFFGGQVPVDVFGPAAEKAPVLFFSPYEATANTPVFQELTNVEKLGKNPDRAWRDAMNACEQALSQRGVS
ncbi:ABC transporter substrate-binding protein [Streptomyces ipomoeae]|uniref:ABC transporter substrate-binding protein n=1 Tax=Streptomyces ipomoeae TaxID=103232 RepID=UPI00114686D9|nr:extracellular solute-binding protein [Streptomyces ipomoeae]MDX2935046.1 extracellular solute-binding protein [Streptomyces ipomoeae]TQE14544.1 extracellular solute-binding protein [Streptomyces ipomoeae]